MPSEPIQRDSMKIPDDNPHKQRAEKMLEFAKQMIRDRTDHPSAEKELIGGKLMYFRAPAKGVLLTNDPVRYQIDSNAPPRPAPATAVVHVLRPRRKS